MGLVVVEKDRHHTLLVQRDGQVLVEQNIVRAQLDILPPKGDSYDGGFAANELPRRRAGLIGHFAADGENLVAQRVADPRLAVQRPAYRGNRYLGAPGNFTNGGGLRARFVLFHAMPQPVGP